MKVQCSGCKHEFRIDDARVPQGAFRVKCPQCGNSITATRDNNSTDSLPAAIETFVRQEISQLRSELLHTIAATKVAEQQNVKPISSVSHPDMGAALLCLAEHALSASISTCVQSLGYSADAVSSSADAMKKLEAADYQLIVVDSALIDDKEGAKKIILRVNGQNPAQRRQTFVVMISSTHKSLDSTAAFLNGVNLIVNKADVANFAALLQEGKESFQQMYQTFSRVMAEKKQSPT